MKKNFTLLLFLLLISGHTLIAQNNLIVSKDAVGPIKMGMNYKEVKPALSGSFKMIWELYHDMIDMMQVSCFDNETDANMIVQFNTGEAPDDKKIRNFYIFSPILKTEAGLGLDSTAQEIIDAGGELDRNDFYVFLKLAGLYFSFSNDDLIGNSLNPKAKPILLTNTRPEIF